MAKYKPAGSSKKRPAPSPTRGLIPCGVILAICFFLLFLLMSGSLKTGK